MSDDGISQLFDLDFSYKSINFVNENSLDNNEICSLYEILIPSFFRHSIFTNKKQKEKNINTDINNFKIKDFLNNIAKNISNIPLLISKKNNNNKNNNDESQIYKKYFQYKEIKEELNEIKTRNLFLRKKKVCDDIKSIDNLKNGKEKYISLLKLLVNDNTNKKLVEMYLKFLYDEDKFLKSIYNDNYENFNDELLFYSKLLSVEEIIKINFKNFNYNCINNLSNQKNELIKLFQEVLAYKDKKDNFEDFLITYKNYFDNKIFFNMPLDFSNENFFYFRNINIIKYYFKNLYDAIEKEKSNIIKKNIQKESIDSENKKIVVDIYNLIEHRINRFLNEYLQLNPNNNEIINYLIILITQAENNEEFDHGFNMVSYQKNTEKDIIEFCNKNSDKVKYNKISKIIQFNNNYYNANYICLKNLINFNEKYNYEYYKLKYPEGIELQQIKDFYRNVLPLQCFKAIYLTLFGEDALYPFDDKNYTNEFVENYFEFLPMPLSYTSGLTDKFSMKTYFISFLKDVDKAYKNSHKTILQTASVINAGNHEIGHNFVNHNFYMENCQVSIETPRKRNIEFSEGGYYVELALYGRILKYITLAQALYIINEENYKKTFMEFQEGFNKISTEDLKIKGVFSKLFSNFNFDENFLKISKNIFIKQKPFYSSEDEKGIIPRLKNDVIGKIINNENYYNLLNKYT